MITKQMLRKKHQYLRNQMSLQSVYQKSELIVKQILDHQTYVQANQVFVYMAMLNEVHLSQVIEDALGQGKVVAIPKILNKTMRFYQINSLDQVSLGHFNVLEPIGDMWTTPTTGDLVLVPGIVFDYKGYRIGYGGGYYDRFLAAIDKGVYTIGVSYKEQLIDTLPIDRYDIPVESIITDEKMHTIKSF